MTCPECGTKLGVFRRKFSNTAYCSEACRQKARQKQNQSSLDLLLSNKKHHLAHSQPAPVPVPAVVVPEAPPERAREAVHSGVLAGFAPFRRPGAPRAPVGVALLEERLAPVEPDTGWQDPLLHAIRPSLGPTAWLPTAMDRLPPMAAAPLDSMVPAETDWGARWPDAVLHAIRPGLGLTGRVLTATKCLQPLVVAPLDSTVPAETDWGARWHDAILHAARPGLGLTGWIVTAMSCLQPLAVALPASGEPGFAFTTTLARACDTLHPIWEQPAADPEPEPEVEAAPLRWIARPPAPTRLADQWLGLSAASDFVNSVQAPPFRAMPALPGFALFAACKPTPASLPAGTQPGSAVDGRPLAFDFLPAAFDAPLTTRLPQPALAACSKGPPQRCLAALDSAARPEFDSPMRWVHLESGVRSPRLGNLSPAAWANVQRSATTGSAGIQTNSEAARWRYDVCRSSGERLRALAPDWKLLSTPVVEAVVEVKPEVAIAVPIPVPVEAAIPPPAGPSRSAKDRLADLRERIHNFPGWTRRLAFHLAWLLPLALAGVWFGPAIRANSSGTIPAQWDAVKASIQRRATIDLEDDFRGGLNHWNGAEGWAKTWSYDATGLLHPGTLALYLASAGLDDYSLEFLGVIEKRALGWTYRTADMRNYYAARLALTRRGNIPTLDLERYAVIDGRQDRRVQLPLPVVLSNITSFRVRTDVKGSRFTTYLNGKIIDAWSDERLTRGGDRTVVRSSFFDFCR